MNVDWIAVLINWFPMLLIAGMWVLFLMNANRGGYAKHNQKLLELTERQTDALDRIAAALEKRP